MKRIEPHRLADRADAVLGAVHIHQVPPVFDQKLRVVGVRVPPGLEMVARGFEIPRDGQGDAQRAMGLGLARVVLQRLLEAFDSGLELGGTRLPNGPCPERVGWGA